ncbi:unnamed protein product [Rotaria sp. Silwood2]|nr:unnamed protein product [Rotaria sp. Silwood2]CAF4460056.1 unnamed protein product [Rotaria sp. Silwood2]
MSNIDLWNVFDFDSRTNNVCEGDGFRLIKLNSRICCNHPNVWTLINCMKAEENRAQSIKLQWSSGASKPKNKRTTALQSPINTLYDRHNNYFISPSDLLNSLSLIVAKKKIKFLLRSSSSFSFLIHDKSTFKSGEVSHECCFFQKGHARQYMISDFLVQCPSGPLSELSENQWKQVVRKYQSLSVHGDVNYLDRTAMASINIRTGAYFDNGMMLGQFERSF